MDRGLSATEAAVRLARHGPNSLPETAPTPVWKRFLRQFGTHVKRGDVAQTLALLADKLGCDTIVMGTRGLGAISGLTPGSVTRKLLHLSRIPVICVK